LACNKVSQVLDLATERLADAGIEQARHEARLLLAHVTGLSKFRQIADPDHPIEGSARSQFEALIARREKREPISHLTGEREFWSLPFSVSSAVLDPRPDSETLVEVALERFSDLDSECSVLDLGTGSGCLLLSFLKNRLQARGVGVDLSADALCIAARNAEQLGLSQRVQFIRGDWATPLDGPFDLILCNPPYIKTADLTTLAVEVECYEPRAALDGGDDGLVAYRKIIPQLPRLMQSDSVILLEIGAGQANDIVELVNKYGLLVSQRYCDLAGTQRCLSVTGSAAFTVS